MRLTSRGRAVGKLPQRGMTLLEVLVSIAILTMVSVLLYGAFDGLTRGKQGIGRINQRYREGRSAIRRINAELSSAFLSMHVPINASLSVRTTVFIGTNGTPADRLDFASFSHIRVARDAHESDQNELSYFGSEDPEVSSKYDLVRREQVGIDLEPKKGGAVNVMVEDIDLFDLKYLDPMSGMWTETWDTTQAVGQAGRLPLQVKITLALRNGPGGKTFKLESRTPIAIQTPLNFAIPK